MQRTPLQETRSTTERRIRVRHFPEIHSQSSNGQRSSHFGQLRLVIATLLTIPAGAADDGEASPFRPGVCTAQTNQCYQRCKLDQAPALESLNC